MNRLDDVLRNGVGRIDARLGALKEEFERLSESTVAEKSELNWAFNVKPTHVGHLAKLWLSNEPANALARLSGKWRPAASGFAYPEQENGALSPAWNADGTPRCTFKGMATDGMGDGRALADKDGAQVAAFGSVVAPGFSRENTNAAFDAGLASLEAGRAGTAVGVGEAAAIRAEAQRTVERDPLLEQMMAEERERAQAGGQAASAGAADGDPAGGQRAASGARRAGGRLAPRATRAASREPAAAAAPATPANWTNCATGKVSAEARRRVPRGVPLRTAPGKGGAPLEMRRSFPSLAHLHLA